MSARRAVLHVLPPRKVSPETGAPEKRMIEIDGNIVDVDSLNIIRKGSKSGTTDVFAGGTKVCTTEGTPFEVLGAILDAIEPRDDTQPEAQPKAQPGQENEG